MARTPDRTPGPSSEEETQYEDRGPGGDASGDPTVDGALRRVTDSLRIRMGGTVRQVIQAKNVPVGFDEIDMAGISNGQGLAYNSTTKQFAATTFAGGFDIDDVLVDDITGDVLTEDNYGNVLIEA